MNKKMLIVLVVIGVIATAAIYFLSDNSESKGLIADTAEPKSYAFDDYTARSEIMNNNLTSDEFAAAVNEFSYKTASLILKNDGNINYSPISLYYAVSIAASGADGVTADELLSLLCVADRETLSKQSGNLYRKLYTDNEIGKLKIANSLWITDNVEWKEDYFKNAAENFYAQSYSVDFSDSKTGNQMAKWIADNTNGTLEPQITTDPDYILAIINTIYLKDEWIEKFDENRTADDIFYLPDDTEITFEFMNAGFGSHHFARGDGFTRSSLGLKNAGGMIFILPDEEISPRDLISDAEKMREVFEGGESYNGQVTWQVPKFSFDCRLDLVDTLKTLGINSAFEEEADFSHITDQTAVITDIRQETHIAIDENGVEASAFTMIMYAGTAMPQESADMILNRPFLYGITAYDGTLLFVGICENPAE